MKGKDHMRVCLVILVFAGAVAPPSLRANTGETIAEVAEKARQAMCPSERPDYFKLALCDDSPTVCVGNTNGYRMVLSWRVALPGPGSYQQAICSRRTTEKVDIEYEEYFLEIILFPQASDLAEDVAKRIPWVGFESKHHVEAVDMGTGYGFRWFGRMNLWSQDDLRERLGLIGGGNRADLAARGLAIRDKGTCTANSMRSRMGRFGDDGVRAVKDLLDSGDFQDPWYIVLGLASIPSKASTDLLVQLYKSQDSHRSRAAAYALIHKPYRKAARATYLDMLRRGLYSRPASEACVEFQWYDATPLLRESYLRQRSPSTALAVLKCLRDLEKRPVPPDLTEAHGVLLSLTHQRPDNRPSPTAVTQAKEAIRLCRGREAAVLAVICVSLGLPKGDNEAVREIGRQLLQELPRDIVMAQVNRFVNNQEDESDKRKYRNMISHIEPQ